MVFIVIMKERRNENLRIAHKNFYTKPCVFTVTYHIFCYRTCVIKNDNATLSLLLDIIYMTKVTMLRALLPATPPPPPPHHCYILCCYITYSNWRLAVACIFVIASAIFDTSSVNRRNEHKG